MIRHIQKEYKFSKKLMNGAWKVPRTKKSVVENQEWKNGKRYNVLW